MIVKIQKPIKFNNKCEAIFDHVDLEKAINWYSSGKPTYCNKVVYLNGKYAAVSIFKEKIHVHRLLMQYWIGKRLATNFHVDHINSNKLDNRNINLRVLSDKEHLSITHKGRIFSPERCAKMSENNRKRKGIKMKRKYQVSHEDLIDIYYKKSSKLAISKKYGCDWSVINQHYNEFIHKATQNPELLTQNPF